MPSAFDLAFEHVVGIEGRYSNNPNDSGGETMFGITRRLASAYGYDGPMRKLPFLEARRIYKLAFWDVLRLDHIAEKAPTLAEELFDSSVNVGDNSAGKWLQRALNALNLRGSLYGDMPIDGRVGPVTLASFDALVRRRGHGAETALRRLCDAQQACFYLDLSQKREKDEDFIYGWVMNRVGA